VIMAEDQKHPGGRPSLYNETMPKMVKLYMQECEGNGKLPKRAGLALFIGVGRSTLQDWATEHEEFSASLELMNCSQEDILCDKGLNNQYNSTITKLMLSSNHGYKERNDTTSGDEPLQPVIINFADLSPKKNEEEQTEEDNGGNSETAEPSTD